MPSSRAEPRAEPASRAPHVGIVLGTRPEIVKNWSIVAALQRRGVRTSILHTNQHRDRDMSGSLFAELGYAPTALLDGEYTFGRAIDWVRAAIDAHGIDLVVVNGDTAAALVGALAAVYSDRRLAHVEAGLRSYDAEMYEERNRIMVDAAAHWLLTYTDREAQFLAQRPELRGVVRTVGNTTVDLIEHFGGRFERPRREPYAYVTLHRKELTDRPAAMREVFRALAELARTLRVVFPMHPRTRDAMQRHGIGVAELGCVEVTGPIGAFASLAHVKHAALVVTDSGCVQEEACIVGVPCVTARENTERVATLEIGANVLAGWDRERIVQCALQQLARRHASWPAIYGSQGAGERIAAILAGDEPAPHRAAAARAANG